MDRLTEIEAFAAVVDQGGFTDAARRMGISKSAVSKHVAALETRLGARLLNRTTRRVSPTELGLAYYDRARRLLTDAGEAEALVRGSEGAPSGHLRLSVTPEFGRSHVLPLVAGFLGAHQAVAMTLILSDDTSGLEAGVLDLAIRIGPPEPERYRERRLATTRAKLVAAPSYVQQAGRPLRVDDLAGHRLLHSAAQAQPAWSLTTPSGEERDVRATGRFAANDSRALLEATLAGLGIARLPGFLVADALASGALTEVMADHLTKPQDIFAIHPAIPLTPSKVRAFIEHLETALAERGAAAW
jgi:DNA-binding transcriptional LysR family regulator